MADTPTPEQQAQAFAFLASMQAKGGSPATAAPPTQKFLARWNEETKGFDFYRNDNYVEPKAATPPAAVSGSQYGTWEPDPANPGQYRQVVPPQVGTAPNVDEDVSKAVKRQNDEAQRNERIANEAAGHGYVTAKELSDITTAAQARNLDDNKLKLEIDKFGQQRKTEDARLALEAAKTTAEIAQSGATVGKIGAETDLTRAQITALGIKTESDTARALAAGVLDKAQADKINAELKKPEAVATAADQPFLVRRDPQTGQQIVEQNPNYQGPKAPTTRGEIAQRTALLQTQMAQMRDKIFADKSIPADQQSARFNQWYDQNVAPQVGALEQQQQSVISDEAQKAAEAQQKNLTAASAAMQGMAPYRVGPGYGQAFEGLVQATANQKFPGVSNAPVNLGTGWSTYKGPSIDQSVQDVLAARQPVQPGMDLQSLLSRNQWTPGGGGGPPPGAPGGPGGPGGPPPPTPEQLAAITAAGQQTAAAGANPANSPLGAIGANPMLAAIQARNRQLASQQTATATANPANSPFGALGAGGMPQAAPMPMASGSGPLPYNPGAFSGIMPLLPGFDYSQFQNQWQPSY